MNNTNNAYAPQQTPGIEALWNTVALVIAGLAALSVTVLPWLAGSGGVYRALPILLGRAEGVDHALIMLPFVASLLALTAALGSAVSPGDARHWRGFLVAAGLVALIYYFNFFINKANPISDASSYARSGFWLLLLAGAGLTLLGTMPRRLAVDSAPPTRFSALMQSSRFWGAMYLLPMLVLMLTFSIYPVFDSVRITLYNWQGIGEPTQFVGLRHFFTVARDPAFWNAFWNTAEYTALLVPIQLSLALVLAIVLDTPGLRLRTFYRTLYFLPVVTSIAIVAIVVRLMLQSGGAAITGFLGFDPPVNPIGSPKTSMLAVTAFGTWYSFGINLVYFLAALQTVPRELYDAASVDGADFFRRIWHITLPSIRPVALIISFFAILGSLRVFEQSFVLTGGGPFFSSEVVSGYIYRYAFGTGGLGGASSSPNLGFASAAAFFMSLLILGVTLLQLAVTRLASMGRR